MIIKNCMNNFLIKEIINIISEKISIYYPHNMLIFNENLGKTSFFI